MSRAAQTEAGKIRNFGRYAHASSLAVSAAAALLASWITEVGRQASHEAEALRREAELVV